MIFYATDTEEIAHDLKILNTDLWKLRDGIAITWHEGRVILAGDAARITPSTGFGLDTGTQDINNLYWKVGNPKYHNRILLKNL